MRRSFWVALGLGAGATGAVVASRWARRQARRVAPTTIAREAKGGLLDLGKLVSESISEGRRAMSDREEELRADLLGDDAAARSPATGVGRRPPAP
jgi:hypothetical protein